MSLDGLLSEAGLAHLSELLRPLTLKECISQLDDSRTAFLSTLKNLGCDKLPERQAVANAIGKAQRLGRLAAGSEVSSEMSSIDRGGAYHRSTPAVGEASATTPSPLLQQPRIWLVSDVHTDHKDNMEWLTQLESHGGDVLVLAGDISHDLKVIEATLRGFVRCFGKVFYCPGNHEAWCGSKEKQAGGDSLTKLEEVEQLCAVLGVSTQPELVGRTWIVPLRSWYDLSLDITAESIEPTGVLKPLAEDFHEFGWSDFAMCQWPSNLNTPYNSFAGTCTLLAIELGS